MAYADPPGVRATNKGIVYGPRFASQINSPSWEWAEGIEFLEVTRGCSHNACRFCTFFKDVPYAKVPRADVEHYVEYLELLDKTTPIRRVFLQGANAFHLSYDELMELSGLIHAHLPHLESIGGYGRMSDLRDKSVEQLKALHDAGYGLLFFGVESADDKLLKYMNKGYGSAELYEAGMKLKESGMPWTSVIMLGFGGRGYGPEHAIKTAEFFSAVEPTVIGAVSLTLVYDEYSGMEPPLLQDVRKGLFVEAGEVERYIELREFIEHLEANTLFSCMHSTMPRGFTAKLPEQKEDLLAVLNEYIANANEDEMNQFRAGVREV